MNTASHTMIARRRGHQTERRGFIMIVVCATVLFIIGAVQLALTHPTLDGTEQAQ